MFKQQTFLFYDYETFGNKPFKDRISQFASIRTDIDFNIIEEPTSIYCQPCCDYIPHPEAVLITKITPQRCQKKGLIEPSFAKIIHDQMSTPNTCIIGYNNIRFDDEMTRYLFFRNFFDPYQYSYDQGNSRWDLLNVVRTFYALRPEGIIWPKDENNLPLFSLEELTKANHIEHQSAHDALSDVYATIGLAKLLKQKQSKLFNYLFDYRQTAEVKKLIDLDRMTPLVHISGMFGAIRGNCSIISPMCIHPELSNSVICVDLMKPVEGLLTLSAKEIHEKLYTKTEELAENETRIPLKVVALNRCPVLIKETILKMVDFNRIPLDLSICRKNYNLLHQHKEEIILKLKEIYRIKNNYSNTEPEASLYDGFINNPDKTNLKKLHSLEPHQLSPIELLTNGILFKDQRINSLIFLYRAKHYPETLSVAEKIQWNTECKRRLESQINDFSHALAQAKQMHINNHEKLTLLSQLEEYVSMLYDNSFKSLKD